MLHLNWRTSSIVCRPLRVTSRPFAPLLNTQRLPMPLNVVAVADVDLVADLDAELVAALPPPQARLLPLARLRHGTLLPVMTITPAAGRESTVNFVTSLVMSPRIASNSFPTNVRRRPTTPPIHLLLHLLRPTVAGSWTPQLHITSPTTSAISLSTLITTDRMKSTWVMVQDLRTGARLLTGRNKGDTYELPHQSAAVRVALVTTSHSPDSWHRRLGHPSSKSLLRLLRTQSLPHSSKSLTHCNSCLSNKSHKLPFGDSSLSSTRPFDL
ncbi:unnamed protein product, partial [Linum tenue]